MNSKEQGSAAIGLLIAVFFAAAIIGLLTFRINENFAKSMDYVRGMQLRRLCASYMQAIADKELPPGKTVPVNVTLEPGQAAAVVSGNVEYGADDLLRYITVTASSSDGEDEARLRQLRLSFSEANYNLAQSCMLISGRAITGTEYLPDGVLYASNQEVVLPRADSLKSWAVDELPAEDLKLVGLNSRMYYLKSSSDFKINSSLKVYGDAVIATEGNIVIGKNVKFYGRVILLSTRNITIESGAVLPKVTLLAHGKVTVAKGASLTGAVFAKSGIEFTGTPALIHDASVVAPFASVFYII